jgi:hypothetical protein
MSSSQNTAHIVQVRRAVRRETDRFGCSRVLSRSIQKVALIDAGIPGYGFEP